MNGLSKQSSGLRIAAAVLLLVAALVAVFGFHVQGQLGPFLTYTQEHRLKGGLIYSLLYAICTVFFIGGLVLSLGAGAIFGLVTGVTVVWTGASLGLLLAFLIGRFLLRDIIARAMGRYTTWQAIEAAINEEGWKIILLLRLAPAVPFNLLNYALSLSAIPFSTYAWTSVAGILPGTVMFVYLGSVANDVEAIIHGKTRFSPAITITTSVVSGIAIIGSGTLLTVYARRALQSRLGQGPEEVQNESNDGLLAADLAD